MKSTRREFLKTSAVISASSMAPLPVLAQAAAAPADMSIARWKGDAGANTNEMARRLTEESMKAIGGMGRFVKKGDVVWVKPNIGWDRTPEQAANTHPEVVKTLVRLCLEAGAKAVKVGDNTCNDAPKCYKNSGIEAAAKEAGAEVVYLDKNRYIETKIGGKKLDSIPLYPDIMECSLILSCPVAKHHSVTRVTACMKNFMGVMENRRKFHQDLPNCIAELTQHLKPKISIALLDATRILMAHGPTGGDLADVKVMNTVAAGVDLVALDAFASELLGNDPAQIGTVTVGQEYGLGKMDYKSLNLKELEIA